MNMMSIHRYNEFRSVIAQNRKIEKLLPIDPRNLEGDETFGSIDYIYDLILQRY